MIYRRIYFRTVGYINRVINFTFVSLLVSIFMLIYAEFNL